MSSEVSNQKSEVNYREAWRAERERRLDADQGREEAEARVAELEAELTACKANKTLAIDARNQAEAKLAEAKQQISNLIHEGGKARNDARGWLASFYDESD